MSSEKYLYLAKSNKANPELLRELRAWLKTIPYKEYNDNTIYSEDLLLNSSFSIVVLGSNILGKGVFEEIVKLKQYKIPFFVIFPYTTVDNKNNIYVMESSLEVSKTTKDNDYINWGRITKWGYFKGFDFGIKGFNSCFEVIKESITFKRFIKSTLKDINVSQDYESLIPTENPSVEGVVITNSTNSALIKEQSKRKAIRKQPLTPDECYKYNIKHLLILRRRR